jgi:hypothetical protein
MSAYQAGDNNAAFQVGDLLGRMQFGQNFSFVDGSNQVAFHEDGSIENYLPR